MAKSIQIPTGRLAGMEYANGILTLTILEGALAGRMHVLRTRVLDTEEEVLWDLCEAAANISSCAADMAKRLEMNRTQGRLL